MEYPDATAVLFSLTAACSIFKNCFLQAKEQGFGTQKQWEKGGEIPPEKNV